MSTPLHILPPAALELTLADGSRLRVPAPTRAEWEAASALEAGEEVGDLSARSRRRAAQLAILCRRAVLAPAPEPTRRAPLLCRLRAWCRRPLGSPVQRALAGLSAFEEDQLATAIAAHHHGLDAAAAVSLHNLTAQMDFLASLAQATAPASQP